MVKKLLVMSNFSFSHSVFKRLVLQTRENQGLFGKGSNHTGSQRPSDSHSRPSIHEEKKSDLEQEPPNLLQSYELQLLLLYWDLTPL